MFCVTNNLFFHQTQFLLSISHNLGFMFRAQAITAFISLKGLLVIIFFMDSLYETVQLLWMLHLLHVTSVLAY